MSFLVKFDLHTAIKEDELEVLLEDTPNGTQDLTDSIDAVVVEIGSFIGHRYDTALVFIDVREYDTATATDTDGVIALVADAWAAETYEAGEMVSHGGKVWNASGDTLTTDVPGVAGVWVLAGVSKAFYKSLVDGNIELPSDLLSWEKVEDPRNKLIRRLAVDMVLYELYARINPRQIPEHRVKKHDDAVGYLKMSADPRKNITIEGLDQVDHGTNSGVDITFGSNDKQSHSW